MLFELESQTAPRGTVADILKVKGSTVRSISPQATVLNAIMAMNEYEVGALLVMQGPSLVGIVSERDYTRKVVVLGRSSRDTRVLDIMSVKLVTVRPQTRLAECMHLVTQHRVRHLPVLQGTGVVGIVSIGDLVQFLLSQQTETIDQLTHFVGADYPS